METRRLGNTDLDLTPVGFGTWAIGGGEWGMGWGPQAEKDSIESILAVSYTHLTLPTKA